jgi:hypothetical protein
MTDSHFCKLRKNLVDKQRKKKGLKPLVSALCGE